MIHFTFKCLQQDSSVKENFKVQINQVLESVTCNQRPYLQITTTVYSLIFCALTKIN